MIAVSSPAAEKITLSGELLGRDHLSGGIGLGTTLRRNRLALDSLALRQRVLVNVADIDITTSELGQTLGDARVSRAFSWRLSRRWPIPRARVAVARAPVARRTTALSSAPRRSRASRRPSRPCKSR